MTIIPPKLNDKNLTNHLNNSVPVLGLVASESMPVGINSRKRLNNDLSLEDDDDIEDEDVIARCFKRLNVIEPDSPYIQG